MESSGMNPGCRTNHAMVTVGKTQMIVWGGLDLQRSGLTSTAIHVLNFREKEWANYNQQKEEQKLFDRMLTQKGGSAPNHELDIQLPKMVQQGKHSHEIKTSMIHQLLQKKARQDLIKSQLLPTLPDEEAVQGKSIVLEGLLKRKIQAQRNLQIQASACLVEEQAQDRQKGRRKTIKLKNMASSSSAPRLKSTKRTGTQGKDPNEAKGQEQGTRFCDNQNTMRHYAFRKRHSRTGCSAAETAAFEGNFEEWRAAIWKPLSKQTPLTWQEQNEILKHGQKMATLQLNSREAFARADSLEKAAESKIQKQGCTSFSNYSRLKVQMAQQRPMTSPAGAVRSGTHDKVNFSQNEGKSKKILHKSQVNKPSSRKTENLHRVTF